MVIRTRAGDVTFGEFMEIVREDQKADLIDGVIYMASPENIEHNDVIGWLVAIIRPFVDHRRLGKVTVNRVAYRLTNKNAPEPDVAVILSKRLGDVRRGYVAGPPDLAIEVVSPESVHRDYELKRRRYEKSGVQEYWIIDPDERQATFFCLGEEGFIEQQPEKKVFHSRVLPGLAVDVRWFWQRPLPDTLAIVQSLVGRTRKQPRSNP